MFGKRGSGGELESDTSEVAEKPPSPVVAEAKASDAAPPPSGAASAKRSESARARPAAEGNVRRSENFYDIKSTVFSALIDTIDLSQLAGLDPESAREEIRDIVNDIIAIKNFAMSIAEQEELLEDICNDVLGYGPLEPLLARDDIADIMVNGAATTYIEVNGKVQKTA